MNHIEKIARDTLTTAHDTLSKSRRNLLFAAGLLALIHLLTVHPYLKAAGEITRIEASMATNTTLVTALDSKINKLRAASDKVGRMLDALLERTTNRMITDFADLRTLVQHAKAGNFQVGGPTGDSPIAVPGQMQPPSMPAQMQPPQMQAPNMPAQMQPPQMQQMQIPNMPPQMQAPNLPPQMRAPQMGIPNVPPPMQQMQIPNLPPQPQYQGPDPSQFPGPENLPFPGSPSPAAVGPVAPYWPPSFGPELQPILQAIGADNPEGYERLIEFARSTIVKQAYADAQGEWNRTIRPAYLFALKETGDTARRLAEHAPAGNAKIAAELLAAADKLSDQQGRIEALEIRHDAGVDAALGSDWWHTVQGKGAFRDAVSESIHAQLSEIGAIAAAPSASITQAIALQEALRDELKAQQARLEAQYGEQRKQLASLSGISGVIPVDLASFIGLFPLVLGLVLGLLMLRGGEARREAAQAAADLAQAAPEDRETRLWLAARAMGAKRAQGPVAAAVIAAVTVIAWIVLAGLQVAGSTAAAPLSPWLSGAIAVMLVAAATGWDVMSMRRLAAELKR